MRTKKRGLILHRVRTFHGQPSVCVGLQVRPSQTAIREKPDTLIFRIPQSWFLRVTGGTAALGRECSPESVSH